MKIITRGIPIQLMNFRFKCPHCDSILECNEDELIVDTVDDKGKTYKYDCPVCERTWYIHDDSITKVGVEDDKGY